MTKGEQTKEAILQQAASLFNRRGFFGSALSDVMEATGLEKGGIYNHFKSKDDLALQAFDYAVDLVRDEMSKAIKSERDNVDRLRALVGVFDRQADGHPLPGGCPVMNTAIEADDAHPALRERARLAMEEWHQLVEKLVERGKQRGEIRPDVDPLVLSTVLISTAEGALMQSKLYGRRAPMDRAVSYLTEYLENNIRAG